MEIDIGVPEGFEPLALPMAEELLNVSMTDKNDLPGLPWPGARKEMQGTSVNAAKTARERVAHGPFVHMGIAQK